MVSRRHTLASYSGQRPSHLLKNQASQRLEVDFTSGVNVRGVIDVVIGVIDIVSGAIDFLEPPIPRATRFLTFWVEFTTSHQTSQLTCLMGDWK